MRVAVALLLLLLLATFAPARLHQPPNIPAHLQIRFDPVPLDEDAPARRRIGGLTYLGGWALRGNDPRFGGISAIHVEGGEAVSVTDRGSVIRFPLPGVPGGSAPRLSALGGGPGSNAGKRNRDSEAMVVANGRMWISFEYRNALWRYDPTGRQADAVALPPAMARWSRKAGGEAMVRMKDGRFLILSEGQLLPDGSTEALLFDGDPMRGGASVLRLRYRAPKGYRITDAALLADSRILFLNRRVSLPDGITAKLTLGVLPELKEGALLTGREIASFRPPVIADNLEALSVQEGHERTIVWIASDDNFSPLQRTLLLKFALEE
ncbi:MAG: esterase-like activity of phytase family protein [Sphingosinicella sp.]|nr:esterase-like activity of phytase family protein [Sphingosinicella sp.]